jgi:hypothetical protein
MVNGPKAGVRKVMLNHQDPALEPWYATRVKSHALELRLLVPPKSKQLPQRM